MTSIVANETLTRIGKSQGEWAKVQLENGMIGYVYASYLKEVPEPTITAIEISASNPIMQRGTTQNMTIKIIPEDAIGQIVWESEDENVLSVDENGLVYAVRKWGS